MSDIAPRERLHRVLGGQSVDRPCTFLTRFSESTPLAVRSEA